MRWLLLVLSGLCIVAPQSRADDDALARRLAQVRGIFSAKPIGLDTIFAPSFLKAVPPEKITSYLREYHARGGPVISVLRVASHGPHRAEYRFYTRTTMFPLKLTVDASPPHLVTGLWFGHQGPRVRELGQVAGTLKALPGQVSFAICELGGKVPRQLGALDPDRQLALGSTFKLYVLGALVQSKRPWDEVIRVRADWRSWPSGMLHEWPSKTPVTLATLAGLMISISDNTATDHLLYTLGRPVVEGMLATMGHAQVQRNVPFLSTREMFRLKEVGKRRVEPYLARDVAGRRAYLGQLVRGRGDDFKGLDRETPTAIDRAEWFASATDLCRAMDWLRRDERARGALSINRGGVAFQKGKWRYVGYKGGSEPGVLNLTYLLQRWDGKWFALTLGWNDPAKPVEEQRLLEIAQSTVLVLESGH